MKYLVIFKTYAGKHYTGKYVRECETYKEMLMVVKQNTISMEVDAVYTIGEKLDLMELQKVKGE